MVMRHGMCTDRSNEKNKFYSLGCYFCNDVVAPTNVSSIDLNQFNPTEPRVVVVRVLLKQREKYESVATSRLSSGSNS